MKEARIEVKEANKSKIDEIIHKYINEQTNYGRCSPNWSKARKQIKSDEKMRKELIERLKAIA
ncbi:MAG: hypothetical protein N3D12_01160 [Candidatus Methanomethyliaceae archaeon]|nr:hypothetical protein [Candidatus Methanomethyliaceae archaeon]